MAVFLTWIALILLCIIAVARDRDWQHGILRGAIIWGCMIVVIAELLGSVDLYDFHTVSVIWLCTDIVLLYLAWKCRDRVLKLMGEARSWRKHILQRGLRPLIFFGLLCLAGLTSITALISPTNNWDSMTYHMSRVMHWLQNGNLDHYPTYYTPQLYHPPWAEIAIANFQILSGSDFWANMVQWLCAVGSVIGVTSIAHFLGAGTLGQVFAAVFVATLPMGLLQAATTQNDYAVCFWLVCFVSTGLRLTQAKIPVISLVFFTSASLGLAMLTKTSAYIIALPFCLYFSAVAVRKWGLKAIKPALFGILIVLSINVGHYTRNLYLFGSPITGGPEELSIQYSMEIRNGTTLLSNAIRNMGFHLGTPSTWVNAKVNGVITKIHDAIGLEPSDPRTTAPGAKFGIFLPSFKEDLAGNMLNFFVFLGALLSFFVLCIRKKTSSIQIFYILNVLAAYLVFCWVLKWQFFNSRHHLALFALIAPWVGWSLENSGMSRWLGSLSLTMIVAAMPWVFKAEFRPWFGTNSIFTTPRIEQYFAQRPQILQTYVEIADLIKEKQCASIGLYWEDDPTARLWEYPLWVVLDNLNAQNAEIRHLSGGNISEILLDEPSHVNFKPCVVLVAEATPAPPTSSHDFLINGSPLQLHGREYQQQKMVGNIHFFVPVEGRSPTIED